MFVVKPEDVTKPAVETVKPEVVKPKEKAAAKTPLVKVEYNGLWYAPELKKFVDPETDVPISDFTFEQPFSQQLLQLPPGNPVQFPSEDTVDWVLEVVKSLPNFWYAHKYEVKTLFFSDTVKQWSVEVTKRDGRNLSFNPGLFAVALIKHGAPTALNALDAEFPKG